MKWKKAGEGRKKRTRSGGERARGGAHSKRELGDQGLETGREGALGAEVGEGMKTALPLIQRHPSSRGLWLLRCCIPSYRWSGLSSIPGARKRILVTCLVPLTLGIPSLEVGGEGCAVTSGTARQGLL